ncbi:addiction module antidote protein [Pseudomonas sp. TE3786]
MSEKKFNPGDMPVLDLDTSTTSLYEASRFLDSPQTISAYLAETIKAQDPQLLMKALAEVAKAQGVNKVAQAAGVNRESLYKSLKGGEKTRFETVRKLMRAVGVELTVQPIAVNTPTPNAAAASKKPATRKVAAPAKPPVIKPVTAK